MAVTPGLYLAKFSSAAAMIEYLPTFFRASSDVRAIVVSLFGGCFLLRYVFELVAFGDQRRCPRALPQGSRGPRTCTRRHP